jgi:cell division protein FtsW
MADRTFVSSANPTRPVRKAHALNLGVDVPMVLIVAAILVIGLLAVYSASWNYGLYFAKIANPAYILLRQVRWVLIGLAVASGLAMVDYHRINRWVILAILGGTVFLLLLVFVVNDDPNSQSRTLLNGSIQPSELAKFAIIIYLSGWMYSKRDQINNVSFGLLPMSTILGFIAGLILLQTDISAAGTIVALGLLLFFLAGGNFRQIMFMGIVIGIAAALVLTISSRGQQRMTDFVNGLVNPEEASYHLKRSMEAIVRGGLFGVGIGKGTTKFTGLPLPWNDSIFAVIAEETGVLGSIVVVGLYILFLWRGISISMRAPDLLGKLLAGGLSIWIAMEAMINIGVMVNLIPFAGNALPLMSAGGSNMVMTLAAVGIILSVSRSAIAEKDNREGRAFSAVVDLRRWDRRRSVPRNRRSPSPRK